MAFHPFQHGQVAVSDTATKVFSSNGSTSSINILNIDTSLTIYIGNSSSVTTSTGYPLAPGASVTVPSTSDVYGISASGTPKVAYIQVQ